MLIANIFLLISLFVTLLLNLLIIISNSKRVVNRALAAFVVSIFLWLLSNLLTNLSKSPHLALIFAKSTLLGAVLILYTFIIFCRVYTNEHNFGYRQAAKLAILPFILLLTLPTRLNIESIGSYGKDTVTGVAYFLLIPLLLGYFGWGLIILTKLYRKTHDSVIKSQLRYIFTGILLSILPTAIANAILPAFGNNTGVLYAPDAATVLVTFMVIAIVKHRLLDIRVIVARSLAYLLLFSSIIVAYSLIVFVVATHVFGTNQFSQKVLPIIAVIFVAVTIQPVRIFFDKSTNRLFYRDAYDPQQFLDQFNKTLVGTYELNALLSKCANIINDTFKTTYCVFSVRKTNNATHSISRIVGTSDHPKFNEDDVSLLHKLTPSLHRQIILADSLDSKYEDLQKKMQTYDIGLISRLSLGTSVEGIGYFIMGPKKSGNMYSSQDIRIIEIVTNELVIAIQNAMRTEEIENFNLTLQQQVDDATRKLRRTNEKLKELDETKDDFISMASHQLRTPLTSVKGYISMIMEEDAGKINHMQREMLGQAFFSSQRMVYLIADLLNVSRLKTGKFVIEPVSVNLASMVQQELEQLEETAAARQLTLVYDKPADFPSLMLDETKTRQVVMNFIDNSIYYTPAGGRIIVRLVNNPSTVELQVEDNGIGVPKGEQHHLFTKFYRAGNARKARPDGTGLGLFMAKKVVLAEGGSIIFNSTQGKGSTFGFVFSKSKLAPPS